MSFARIHGDDLRQVAQIAAHSAFQSYDASRDVSLDAWIAMKVKWAQRDYMRNWLHMSSGGRGARPVMIDATGTLVTHPHFTPEPGLERAIRSMTPRQQELIRLIFWDGLLWREIAELWHVSVHTIGAHYTRAIRHLRRILCAPSYSPAC